jgi:predicted nuclease of predicted toxin-antitoxin system
VRLLLDENLSPRLVNLLADVFPAIQHVSQVGLACALDSAIWAYARANGMIIVSKDSDFHQRSLVVADPPKVVWVRRGNCSTDDIVTILVEARERMERLVAQDQETLLVLD